MGRTGGERQDKRGERGGEVGLTQVRITAHVQRPESGRNGMRALIGQMSGIRSPKTTVLVNAAYIDRQIFKLSPAT